MSQSEERVKRIWVGMVYRCHNAKDHSACGRWYKEKGIKVCDEWRENFEAFKAWAVEHGYRDDLTIDRINPDGNYEPANCQWITRAENSRRACLGKKYAPRVKNDGGIIFPNIEAERARNGMSKAKLASFLGVSLGTVKNWQSGRAAPTSGNLILMADLFKVTIDYLLGRTE